MNKITIYHMNDMHARISTNDDNGLAIGLDQIAKVINKSLLNEKNCLFFNAGDIIHGNPYININDGMGMIPLLNPIHLSALCPGNHEFNFGIEQLLKITKLLNTHILCANVVYKNNQSFAFLPYMIYEIDLNKDDYISENSNTSRNENIKIGVFGLTTPETMYKTHPDNVKNVEILDPIKTGKNIIRLLKNNCDIIIALTHLGLDKSSEFTSERLASEVDNIDLCIDGHSHTVLPHGLRVNNTLIVQAGSHSQYLGKVVLNIENKKIQHISAELLNEDTINSLISNESDSFISNRLNKIMNEADKILSEELAYSNKTLSGDRLLVRRQESELGNFAANACKFITGADISIVNAGDIRTSLQSGTITYKDILAVFPFQNNVQIYEITAQQIKEMLEHSVEFVPASFGGFLSVSSNLKFYFDSKRPPGNRIINIYINDKLIENKTYTISMTSFLAAGGDDYQIFKSLKKVTNCDTVENIIIKYINLQGINEKDYMLGRIIDKKGNDC